MKEKKRIEYTDWYKAEWKRRFWSCTCYSGCSVSNKSVDCSGKRGWHARQSGIAVSSVCGRSFSFTNSTSSLDSKLWRTLSDLHRERCPEPISFRRTHRHATPRIETIDPQLDLTASEVTESLASYLGSVIKERMERRNSGSTCTTMLLRRKPDVEYRGSQAVATISPATAIRLDCPSTGRAR